MDSGGRHKARTFQKLLDALLEENSGDDVSLGDLLRTIGQRSFGPVILLLGFISVTPLTIVPGANWLVALVVLVFSVQLLFGSRYPWLPRKLLETRFPYEALKSAVEGGQRAARIADHVTRPRLGFLTDRPFSVIPALLAIFAALITFPLGLIPLGPLAPGIGLILLGVGLTARDGLFLILASAALAAAAWLVLTLVL